MKKLASGMIEGTPNSEVKIRNTRKAVKIVNEILEGYHFIRVTRSLPNASKML